MYVLNIFICEQVHWVNENDTDVFLNMLVKNSVTKHSLLFVSEFPEGLGRSRRLVGFVSTYPSACPVPW